MKYDIVGLDNSLDVLGYTCKALRKEGLRDLEPELKEEAIKNPEDAVGICLEYLQKANEAAAKNEEYQFLNADMQPSVDDWEED